MPGTMDELRIMEAAGQIESGLIGGDGAAMLDFVLSKMPASDARRVREGLGLEFFVQSYSHDARRETWIKGDATAFHVLTIWGIDPDQMTRARQLYDVSRDEFSVETVGIVFAQALGKQLHDVKRVTRCRNS